MRALVNAQISIKGAIMARRRRDLARFYRKLEWFRLKIAVRRIERGWFKERAFRNRIMVRVGVCGCMCVCVGGSDSYSLFIGSIF